MSKQPPSFTASPDAQIIADKLKAHAEESPEDVLLYQDISATVRRDVQNGANHLLQTAKRIVLREEGLVYETVKGVGIKLVPPTEMHRVAESHLKRSGRSARRGLKKLGTVDVAKLDTDNRARTAALATLLHMQSHASKAHTVKRLEAKVGPDQARLPMADATLAMFGGSDEGAKK